MTVKVYRTYANLPVYVSIKKNRYYTVEEVYSAGTSSVFNITLQPFEGLNYSFYDYNDNNILSVAAQTLWNKETFKGCDRAVMEPRESSFQEGYYNFIKHGHVSIDSDGLATNFTADSYLSFNININGAFTFITKILNLTTSDANIIFANNTTGASFVRMDANKLRLWTPIHNGFYGGDFTTATNVTYYVKCVSDGTTFSLYGSETNGNWTLSGSCPIEEVFVDGVNEIFIGRNSLSYNQWSSVTVYLAETQFENIWTPKATSRELYKYWANKRIYDNFDNKGSVIDEYGQFTSGDIWGQFNLINKANWAMQLDAIMPEEFTVAKMLCGNGPNRACAPRISIEATTGNVLLSLSSTNSGTWNIVDNANVGTVTPGYRHSFAIAYDGTTYRFFLDSVQTWMLESSTQVFAETSRNWRFLSGDGYVTDLNSIFLKSTTASGTEYVYHLYRDNITEAKGCLADDVREGPAMEKTYSAFVKPEGDVLLSNIDTDRAGWIWANNVTIPAYSKNTEPRNYTEVQGQAITINDWTVSDWSERCLLIDKDAWYRGDNFAVTFRCYTTNSTNSLVMSFNRAGFWGLASTNNRFGTYAGGWKSKGDDTISNQRVWVRMQCIGNQMQVYYKLDTGDLSTKIPDNDLSTWNQSTMNVYDFPKDSLAQFSISDWRSNYWSSQFAHANIELDTVTFWEIDPVAKTEKEYFNVAKGLITNGTTRSAYDYFISQDLQVPTAIAVDAVNKAIQTHWDTSLTINKKFSVPEPSQSFASPKSFEISAHFKTSASNGSSNYWMFYTSNNWGTYPAMGVNKNLVGYYMGWNDFQASSTEYTFENSTEYTMKMKYAESGSPSGVEENAQKCTLTAEIYKGTELVYTKTSEYTGWHPNLTSNRDIIILCNNWISDMLMYLDDTYIKYNGELAWSLKR